ncbi:glutathione S-transferase family protein [Bacteriovorax sp. PP10]|uniref:Glutathione S-transferase family protein n=1 Tax=Bacteriovorax antarcticus TaxID=3088717 RepID=A0ABU5VW18_9BACT|nr:glutathione S-transferase family protein [Bacteriovorax sp. PP10]MEA9357264.1 glutathione S-transferase family protein [Bacteriovorax sp. PP10]
MMKPILTTLRWVPPFAHGYVKDLRVRWALEEIGIAYETKLIGPEDQPTMEYRKIQPYGQVPAYEEDSLKIFESGAIALHIAHKSELLLPVEATARARAIVWMFSAHTSIEPYIHNIGSEMLTSRLKDLTSWLEGKDYLEDRFTIGDLIMTTVLRDLGDDDIIMKNPVLLAYRSRCEGRPAFKKALNDQLEVFNKHKPKEA